MTTPKHVLKPWKEVCTLRNEIRTKTLTTADFAVDLHRVIFEPGSGKHYTDPAAFFSSNQWVPVALGAGIALIVHLTKATVRPVVNVATVGLATPVISAVEDTGSIAVSILAILLPILILLVIPLVVWMIWWTMRRRKKRNGRPPQESTVSSLS